MELNSCNYDNETLAFLKKFEPKIKQYYDSTILQKDWMKPVANGIKENIKTSKNEFKNVGMELHDDLIVKCPYNPPEVIESHGNDGYLIGQQIGYNKDNSALIYIYYYLDKDGNFLCPPVIKESYGSLHSGIPSLKGKLYEAGLVGLHTTSVIKNKVLDKYPSSYTYDFITDVVELKGDRIYEGKDIRVIKREQEDGFSYGFDTLYIGRRGYDKNIYLKEIYVSDGKHVFIRGINDDVTNINIETSDGKITINKETLDKLEFPMLARVKSEIIGALSSAGSGVERGANMGIFKFDIEKAQNADIILLFRDNTMYSEIIAELEQLNADKDKPLNIYTIVVDKRIDSFINNEDAQGFIDKFNPITDSTIANRSNRKTKLIEHNNEESDGFFNDLRLLNLLCKQQGIKKLYLLTNVKGYNYNYLLEHGGYVMDKEGNINYISENSAKERQYDGDPVAIRKHYLTDIEIETIGGGNKRDGNENKRYINDIEKLTINPNTILIADRHKSEIADIFRSRGGKVQIIAGKYFEGNFNQTFNLQNKTTNQNIFAQIMAKNILQNHLENKKIEHQGYHQLYAMYKDTYQTFFDNIVLYPNGDIQLDGKLFCYNEFGNYLLNTPVDNINVIDGSFCDQIGNKGPSKGIKYINSSIASAVAESVGLKLLPFNKVTDFINLFPGETINEKLTSLCTLFDVQESGYLDTINDGQHRVIRRDTGEHIYLGLSEGDIYKDFVWLLGDKKNKKVTVSFDRLVPFLAYKDIS